MNIHFLENAALPVSILLMLVATIILFSKIRSTATLFMLISVLGMVLGYYLQNYTPRSVIYTLSGQPFINLGDLFVIGKYFTKFSPVLFALSLLAFARNRKSD